MWVTKTSKSYNGIGTQRIYLGVVAPTAAAACACSLVAAAAHSGFKTRLADLLGIFSESFFSIAANALRAELSTQSVDFFKGQMEEQTTVCRF